MWNINTKKSPLCEIMQLCEGVLSTVLSFFTSKERLVLRVTSRRFLNADILLPDPAVYIWRGTPFPVYKRYIAIMDAPWPIPQDTTHLILFFRKWISFIYSILTKIGLRN